MGLDLYHYKATLSPANRDEAATFGEREFDEDALDGLGLRRFVQIIPDTDYPARILIVNDEESLRILRANRWAECQEDTILLIGEPAGLARQVEQIEEANGWDSEGRAIQVMTHWLSRIGTRISFGHGWGAIQKPLTESTWDVTDAIRRELDRNPAVVHPPVQSMRLCYPVPADYRGLYAEEVGYQRKGMSQDFYKAFGSQSHYVRRSDVLRAARFLDLSGVPEEDQECKQYFYAQFLADFDEGTSIFHVSF